jgi:hypothetical protein
MNIDWTTWTIEKRKDHKPIENRVAPIEMPVVHAQSGRIEIRPITSHVKDRLVRPISILNRQTILDVFTFRLA